MLVRQWDMADTRHLGGGAVLSVHLTDRAPRHGPFSLRDLLHAREGGYINPFLHMKRVRACSLQDLPKISYLLSGYTMIIELGLLIPYSVGREWWNELVGC